MHQFHQIATNSVIRLHFSNAYILPFYCAYFHHWCKYQWVVIDEKCSFVPSCSECFFCHFMVHFQHYPCSKRGLQRKPLFFFLLMLLRCDQWFWWDNMGLCIDSTNVCVINGWKVFLFWELLSFSWPCIAHTHPINRAQDLNINLLYIITETDLQMWRFCSYTHFFPLVLLKILV